MPAYDIVVYGSYTDGVLLIEMDPKSYMILTTEGKIIESLEPGFNIIRFNDGSIKKVFYKP